MPKPWGKYEIDYLDHPKFRALHSNAFRLWWEVKNYCDKFHTDGLFPCEIVKTFRHFSVKNVGQLTSSCGQKPNGAMYAPLWDALDIGGVPHYRMHDYLDHNDCRDVVLARIEKSEAAKKADRDRKAAARAAKAAARPVDVREVSGGVSGDVSGQMSEDCPPDVRPMSGSKQYQYQNQYSLKERGSESSAPTTARSKRPVFVGQRLTVFEWMLTNCLNDLGEHADAFDLHTWFQDLDQRAVRDGLVIPKRDHGEWLQAQLVAEAQRRGLPLRFATAPRRADQRFGKQTTRLMEAVANIKREAQP